MTLVHRKPKPSWLRRRLVLRSSTNEVNEMLRDLNLRTVCQEARCPNQLECFGNRTATFMILGNLCTRKCSFCAVSHGPKDPPDTNEPQRVSAAISQLGLDYVVVTSVSRDDLSDGGASHFAVTVEAIRAARTGIPVEVLVPDFQGSVQSLAAVLDVHPSVLNHNVETVPRLYPAVRPQADYRRSLHLLAESKRLLPTVVTKSGLMVGLGERPKEITDLLQDLRQVDCDLVTIGQYLRPSKDHHPVVEYIHPQIFETYRRRAECLGFLGVASGPYVRSSYQAAKLYKQAQIKTGLQARV